MSATRFIYNSRMLNLFQSQLEFIYRALADGIITEQFTFRHSKIESQYEGLKKQNSATRTSNFEEQFQVSKIVLKLFQQFLIYLILYSLIVEEISFC